MTWVATAIVGAGLGSALIGSRSSDRAADEISGSADAATAEQRRQFDIATGLARPGIEAGDTARNELLKLLGLSPLERGENPTSIINQTPGFQFQLNQGARALNSNRSFGGASGGDLARDFSRFNQGVASDFYRDYANRLANLSGTGQTASNQLGSLGVQSGALVGNSLQRAGDARASGIIGQGNAFGGFLNQLGGAAGLGLFDNIFSGASGGGRPSVSGR